MEKTGKDETAKRSQELRKKLEKLRESREFTEKMLTDCRMRWERMKDEELRFANVEDVESLLEECEEDFQFPSGSKLCSVVIEERTAWDKPEQEDGNSDDDGYNLCSLLNLIWTELIGLILTVYTLLRVPKRKM